jgi:UDP-N-acetylmuramate dehydrogenase
MTAKPETPGRLAQIPDLHVSENALLSSRTRFGIGGPADIYAETAREQSFIDAWNEIRRSGLRSAVIGGGTNLIVSDDGFHGIVLKFTGDAIESDGPTVRVAAGASLQHLVDFSIDHGLAGLHTMTGIPGSTGAAIYGNAGAYGHSIHEVVARVRFFDGREIRSFGNAECEFAYRESAFKRHKDWIVFSAELNLRPGDPSALRKTADEILKIRNEKYPPTMKCAGSIFKNLIVAELHPSVRAVLPGAVVREGKAPSAWFLEQVGAKGMKNGGIEVAAYHANLIYNAGCGTARELREVIGELKERVRGRFGLVLEEEVQYVGFDNGAGAA